MIGEINEHMGPVRNRHDCSEMKDSLQNWDYHVYCGPIMIGGDRRHDVPPPNFLVGGDASPPSPPVAEPMYADIYFASSG